MFPELFLDEADFVIKGEPEEDVYRIVNDFKPQGVIESDFIDNLDTLSFSNWNIRFQDVL